MTVKCVMFAVLVVLGCGDNRTHPSDAPSGDDADASTADLLACQVTHGTTLSARKIATALGPITLATAPPLDDGRLFVLEQWGRIRIVKAHGMLDAPFLDLTSETGGPVATGGELGLLGLAFHPDYATNGTFFVFYTTYDANHQLHDLLARYQVSADPDVADRTGTVVLSIDDFATNHNGGMIGFGPDGYLYIGTGDGGGAGDPMRTAQDPNALLGKMLRIDVDHKAAGMEYGIPAGNPFAAGGGRGEIFALGLRNPWRWSFDKLTGNLWIADVGQGAIEEVDVIPAGVGGLNFGWSQYEGDACYNQPCDPAGKTPPVWSRTHAQGWCSIIGAGVYRGSCYPDLNGLFMASDYCGHQMMAAQVQTTGPLDAIVFGDFPQLPSAIFPDARGELYYTTAPYDGTNGAVYHLEAGE